MSKSTNGDLELFRQSFGNPWAVGHCYELFISSPYSDSSIYSPFLVGDFTPKCSSLTPGVEVECSISSADTLKFSLTSISKDASTEKKISIRITNINTPFSSQNLRTINVRYYSDAVCSKGRSTVSVPSITIQQETMPATNV